MPEKVIDVAVGVLMRPDGTILLGNRPAGKPWPGWWELPGGKLEPDETVLQALGRELFEELGIHVKTATPWVTYVHKYPTTTVRLAFCRVTDWTGEPTGLEGQQLRWVDLRTAHEVPLLLPATYPPLRWLQLPDLYAITSAATPAGLPTFLANLDRALAQGLKLLQWREPDWPGGAAAPDLHAALGEALNRCHAAGARVLVNSVHPRGWWNEADGVHLRAQDAQACTGRPDLEPEKLLAVSAHTLEDLSRARALQASFVVLGPVLPTASHPDHPGIGWDTFATLNAQAGLPVYALGGQSLDTLEKANSMGGHGIACIRGWLA